MEPPPARTHEAGRRTVRVLGVDVTNDSEDEALARLSAMVEGRGCHLVFFVNAHTLNLAAGDAEYRRVLNAADLVYGDGTGVRWAARARSIELKANLNGTDLTPRLFDQLSGRGHTYFILGTPEDRVPHVAEGARQRFPGWTLAGYHHGFIHEPAATRRVIEQINRCRPDVLLVGMGNPLQETWLHVHRDQLDVRLGLAIGGLLDYWAGNLRRAPKVMRSAGVEWMYILAQQPWKLRRYAVGNPLFIARLLAWRGRDLEGALDEE
jgi:N-acetylglucosaminyldiphosphoundecaprenol N-acetyl-beta-D-mannosaminyltransferase